MPRERNVPGGIAAPIQGRQSDLGKGEQIRLALEEFILKSAPETLLPSERVLAEQFGVARMTVRGAMDALEASGMVRRVPGRGAFVQHPRLAHSEVFRSFSEDMRLRGMVPGARGFTANIEPADPFIAENLGIEPGEPVISIERVRTADGIPMAVERTKLPAARFPGLLERMEPDDSLYQLLATHYGVQPETAEQSVAIAKLSAADARRLDTAEGEPCFAITRRGHDNMGNIFEYGRSLYRGDRYLIEMRVAKERIPPGA